MRLEMTESEHTKAVVVAIAKSLAGKVPVLGEAIAGYDAYKQSTHERLIENFLAQLESRVEYLESSKSIEWLNSDDGKLYVQKIVGAALDVQNEEKQQLFANALVNGVSTDSKIEEKTKFIDMLRQLSLASIHVLAEMYNMYEPRTRRPGRENMMSAPPQIDSVKIAEALSYLYEPYVVVSCVKELESVGLFHNIHTWNKVGDKYHPGPGFMNEVAFTDYTARFCEFVSNLGES